MKRNAYASASLPYRMPLTYHAVQDYNGYVDKKSDIQPLIHRKETVHFVPDDRRVDVRWGTYSVVQATLELIYFAMQTGSYDYFWLT